MTTPAPVRGRPLASDQDSREKLLDTATLLFSSQGIAVTTVAAVARQAGVTAAMVHYYFKNRDQLIEAVVDERVSLFIRSIWEPINGDQPPEQMIMGIVDRMISTTEKMPWMPALWVREVLSDGGQLRERMVRRVPLAKLMLFADNIARSQQAGQLNPQLQPDLIFVSVIGLTMLPLAMARTLKDRPSLPIAHKLALMDKALLARHIKALLLHGLAMPGATLSDD
ncbi:TetR/AcrR family transcriptional regulator [Collimonas pratensis]|uniref:Bacterial regulatory s, tetR family protein n=1 Tax=Collimonas pratensis TaxID=279113 RepID=A0ABM5Z6J1_9BURK|nr:TetR/AcrR family transcriptional regulator [Collimonas pratensis]AMP14760.1 bacterial regulatory s, tetR family protein [Collimonas pratensis]